MRYLQTVDTMALFGFKDYRCECCGKVARPTFIKAYRDDICDECYKDQIKEEYRMGGM